MIGQTVDPRVLASQNDEVRKKQALDALKARLGKGANDAKELKEACRGFESMFINQLWKQMRNTVPKEGYLHSKEEDTWLSMFDQEMSMKMAQSGGIGLGDMLYEQLSQQLGEASRRTTPESVVNPKPLKQLRPEPAKIEVRPAQEPQFVDSPEQMYEPLGGDTDGSPDLGAETGDVQGAMPGASDHPPMPGVETLQQVEGLARRIEQDGGVAVGRGGPLSRTAPVEKASGPGPMQPLSWPVKGEVSSDFGWRPDPITGERAWHAGIDLAAEPGDPVGACWDGTVVFAGPWQGYGNLVVLEHEGGWRSYYGHNAEVAVEPGQRVAAGNKIAEVGSTGRSTGTHLHFELRQGDQAWNPKQIEKRLLSGLSIGHKA